MNKERKPEERMNQGPLVPEQIGNLQKTKKKTLIMKMLDAFLVALLSLVIAITVVSMFGHHIYALFKLVAEKEKPEHEQIRIKLDPAPCINGGKPAVPREFPEPEADDGRGR